MRLTTIKLSGFKSFVDPVSIPVNSNLVGIVGPNGCGKSNIIDAVRWVMGESSAKHLRGDTMADVIFNGSSTRKPVGMASVELIFDNSTLERGGPYAAYSTIAIKREVSRDGQSVYMLNGSKCRRKDITDIFLGTGLGTRSYAIIEQGTISRLVEAKPEDLRILIEEAAGISKYKDRRHDTEIRIRHTRENLDRLSDLSEEVDQQIRHLNLQAKKAETFKSLKNRERQLRRELLAIRWHAYREQLSRNEERADLAKQDLDTLAARQATLEGSISESRQEQNRLQQSLNAIQAGLYATGADIVRIEQSIKLANRTREELEAELNRLGSEQERALADLEGDRYQLARIKRQVIVSTESLAYARRLQKTTAHLKMCADGISAEQRRKLDSIHRELASEKERMNIEGSRIDQFLAQNRQYSDRHQRLHAEKIELEKHRLTDEIGELSRMIAALETEHGSIRDHLAGLKERSEALKQKSRDLNKALNEIRSKRQTCEGRIASLERLQQHAMGKDRSVLNAWLVERRLEDSKRLAQDIEVENGWETAVELALGSHLEAVCVDDANGLLEDIARLVEETLAVIEIGQEVSTDCRAGFSSLAEKVRSSCKVRTLLAGIYCAEDLSRARSIAASLGAGESVITADGIWLGDGWIYLNRTRDQKTGVLAREKELRALTQNLTGLAEESRVTEQALDDLERELSATEGLFEEQQARERKISSELSEHKTNLSAKQARHEQFCRRIVQIEAEVAELFETLERNENLLAEARKKRSTAESAMTSLTAKSMALSELNQTLQKFMADINQLAVDARDEVHRLEAQLQNLQSSEQLTGRHLERLENQHDQEIQRAQQLSRKLAEAVAPVQAQIDERDQLIEKRKRQEDSLKLARTRLTESEKAAASLAEQQARNQMEIEEKREMLEKVRLDGQESRVRSQSVLEQLDELHVEREAIPGLLPENPDEALWIENIERVAEKIARLGSINLAAIEEFEEQSKRLEYLNGQHADLIESLQTLEQAIKKIDLESRTRFKTTFDQINAGLQHNFPKLFGGGQAGLELTGDDLLETGVNVIARPPGKRNSSIHLLSGGEKALTAVALVFSIFELNPAPFCMLDEVDAPLDDANVGRFSRLIEEMAERVQFIFITHNKVTMEIARHLAGVTMNEPGVSRMVAVDIDEAVELAVG
ncbi:MAG: chromosome segregation protein SMC [Methylococcaceae bacterium]|nr:chromosome segregation protein SMC [Methylococcaceae bacterium]